MKLKKLVLLTLLTTFFVFVQSAWSFATYNFSSTENVSRETLDTELVRGSIPIPAYKARFCSSLLKSIESPHSAHSVADGQRKVGKVAALSMILGARFALVPVNHKESSHQIDIAVTNPAHIISAYRKCRKEDSLRLTAK